MHCKALALLQPETMLTKQKAEKEEERKKEYPAAGWSIQERNKGGWKGVGEVNPGSGTPL